MIANGIVFAPFILSIFFLTTSWGKHLTTKAATK